MLEAIMTHGDCRDLLGEIPSGSVDAIVTDPPYPGIKRAYGFWTEAEWFELMRAVVPECMRVLKPTGSAVFVLAPNSERVGRMRTWLWEFMAWVGKEYGIIQDAWWWNHATPPTVHCHQEHGLMRPSLKACVWIGGEKCYRNQDAVLSPIAESTMKDRRIENMDLQYIPSGGSIRFGRMLARCKERGGSTPFNVVVCGNTSSRSGHPAGTPSKLCDWWTRYICPEGGTVLEPFMGSGTVGISAIASGRNFVGIERDANYFAIAEKRINAALAASRSMLPIN